MVSREEDWEASGPETSADGAGIAGSGVAGRAEAEVAAGEEHHRDRPAQARAARPLRLDPVRVDVGRLGVLCRQLATALLRLSLGRGHGGGLMELGVKGGNLGLLGNGLGLPRHRLGPKAGKAVLELGSTPRCSLYLCLRFS